MNILTIDDNRPTCQQISEIRCFMLLYVKQLLISSSDTQGEELEYILNYLHTIHEVIENKIYFYWQRKVFVVIASFF